MKHLKTKKFFCTKDTIKKIPSILNNHGEKWEVNFLQRWHATKDGFEVREIYFIRIAKRVKERFLLFFTNEIPAEFTLPKIELKKQYRNIYIDFGYKALRFLDKNDERRIVSALFKALEEIKD